MKVFCIKDCKTEFNKYNKGFVYEAREYGNGFLFGRFFFIEEFDEYFETISNKRKRIINSL